MRSPAIASELTNQWVAALSGVVSLALGSERRRFTKVHGKVLLTVLNISSIIGFFALPSATKATVSLAKTTGRVMVILSLGGLGESWHHITLR